MLVEEIPYDGDDEMDQGFRGGRIRKKKTVAQNNSSIPLSIATLEDADGINNIVLNDILKIVVVGGAETVEKQRLTRRLLRGSRSQAKRASSSSRKRSINTPKGVDVHSWAPVNDNNTKFTIWTVLDGNGIVTEPPCNARFAAHPAGTQPTFFSDRSLYLLVWDLAVNNEGTYRRETMDSSSSSNLDSSDDEDSDNEYLEEVVNSRADRTLQMDILQRVLLWVDRIAHSTADSVILPVALVPNDLPGRETQRRCHVMVEMLLDLCKKLTRRGYKVPKVVSGANTVYCVSLEGTNNSGIQLLEETILATVNEMDRSFFNHVGMPVPKGTVPVLKTAERLKETNHQLVSLELLLSALPCGSKENLSVHQVMVALEFLSTIGKLFYFGSSTNSSDENVDTSNILIQFVDYQ